MRMRRAMSSSSSHQDVKKAAFLNDVHENPKKPTIMLAKNAKLMVREENRVS